MNKQLQIWQFINNNLQRNIPVMLLYVLHSDGSSPGRQGFFMSVNNAGEMQGSIGGGIMEHKFVEMAKEKLALPEYRPSVRKQLHDKTADRDQSGMICSGEQTILIYRVKEKDGIPIQNIIDCLAQSKNGWIQLTPAGLDFSDRDIPGNFFFFSMKSNEEWLYREKLGYINHLYIIGGGHCSLALSKIMRMMDFYIHVYDERATINTFLANEYAHEKTVVDNYSSLKDIIPSGDHQYVVVMTMGYRTDDIVIRSLLDKEFKYFGVLGSKAKMEKMFSGYVETGISEEKLRRIHSPVGMAIKSQTPEEIAISIVAEIIQVKNSVD